MRVVFVGNFSTESVGEPETAYALEREGHEVVRIGEVMGMIEKIEAECAKADLLLFSKCRIGTWNEVRALFERVKCPKVAWIYDLFIGL